MKYLKHYFVCKRSYAFSHIKNKLYPLLVPRLFAFSPHKPSSVNYEGNFMFIFSKSVLFFFENCLQFNFVIHRLHQEKVFWLKEVVLERFVCFAFILLLL